MRQTKLHLTVSDRELIESYRAKGLHHAREVNRAHIWSAVPSMPAGQGAHWKAAPVRHQCRSADYGFGLL